MTDDSLALLSLQVSVRICPVCLEQVEPDPDGDDRHFHHGTAIEPIEVDGYPYLADLRSKRDLALFRLQTDIRDHAFRVGEERWYSNLSVKDRFWEDERRKRVERERRARMSGIERALTSMVDWQIKDLNRQLFSDSPLLNWIRHPWPKPDALDVWLTEDGPIPEVGEALL